MSPATLAVTAWTRSSRSALLTAPSMTRAFLRASKTWRSTLLLAAAEVEDDR